MGGGKRSPTSALVSAADSAASSSSGLPEFVEDLNNVTVAVGRDATMACMVKNLNDYKV